MTIDPRPNSLVISRGAVLDVSWRGNYTGATAAQFVFHKADGTVIATIDGTATDDTLAFLFTNLTVLDAIPHGAAYELLVTANGHPYKALYGTVVRREASSFGDIVRAIV